MRARQYTIFSTLHPAVLMVYFAGAMGCSMIISHPLFVGLSFGAALICAGFFCGNVGKSFAGILPLMLLIVLANFLLNHRGVVILFQIGHRAYTAESLCFGISSALMLGSVFLWFRCYNVVITTEKFLYLFGRRFPGTSLLLSMILKLFPETKYKIRCIREGQRDFDGGGKLGKSMRQISCLLDWSMEDSIETADSMRARGYGEGKRSSYLEYRLTMPDRLFLGGFLAVFCLLILCLAQGQIRFAYFPAFSREILFGPVQAAAASAYGLFLLCPVILEGMDMFRQNILRQSKRRN